MSRGLRIDTWSHFRDFFTFTEGITDSLLRKLTLHDSNMTDATSHDVRERVIKVSDRACFIRKDRGPKKDGIKTPSLCKRSDLRGVPLEGRNTCQTILVQ